MSITTLSLYESLLKHDRPIAWWGFDTTDPLEDDSGHGYTLTNVNTPTDAASLVTHGDGGASGSRDFNGTTQRYTVDGTIMGDPTEPPVFVDSGQITHSSVDTMTIVVGAMQAGDLMLIQIIHGTAAATITSTPAGWTQVGTTLNAGSVAVATFKRTPSSDEPAAQYEWVWSASANQTAVWGIWRGADPGVSGLVYDSDRQATSSDDFHQTTTETNPIMARAIVFWADEATAQIIPDATAAGEFREQVNLLADPGTFMRLALLDYFIPEAGSVTKSCSTSVDTTLGATLVTFGSPNATQEDVLDSIAETMSIHVLIRPDTVAAGSRTIIRKHQAWGLQLNGATVEFLYRDGGGVDRTVTGPTVSASTVTHLVVVDDGTTIHFYKDGVETTAARAGTAGYTQNTNTVNIGAYHNGVSASNFWDGRLDELAIWNVALSDNMASSYYVAHSAGTFGTDLDSRMPRVKLEIAWASAPTDECLVWEDMTDYARNTEGLAIQRGRSAELDRAETGTMNFALSCNEREFDPNYASSPFYPNVKPTRAVRFRAQSDTDAVVWSRFFGYTQGWPQRRNQGAFDIVAVFTAADPAFALALDKVQGSMARPPEYAGDRLDAVLGDIPNLKVDLEAGQSELVAADLDGVNRLEHSQAVVESDGGILFAAGDGTMTFHDRHHRTIYESTVRATYGDGGGSELPIEHQEPAIDEGHLFTAARITDAFGRVASASDDAAALEHFVRTKDLATLQTNANEAQAMAEAFAHRYATPRERIPDLRINPTAHPTTPLTMWETALGHEIGHRIETVERVGGDGSSVSREVFIEGITDRVRARDWRISLRTSPADLEGNYWLLGTGELGDEEGITSTALGW